jgi:hypothetical protein
LYNDSVGAGRIDHGSGVARQISRTAQRSISLESAASMDFQSFPASRNLDFNRSDSADQKILSGRGSKTNSASPEI